MRRHFGLVGLVFVAGLLVAGTMPVQAATPLTIDDAKGDAIDGRASMDFVKIKYDVRQVNKSGPQSLVVEMTLAAPPESRLVTYSVDAKAADDCFVYASYRPSTLWESALNISTTSFFTGCGEDSSIVAAKTLIKDNVVTLSTALDSLPKKLRQAGELKEIYAYSQVSEPILGILGNGWIDYAGHMPTATDSVTTDKTFKL